MAILTTATYALASSPGRQKRPGDEATYACTLTVHASLVDVYTLSYDAFILTNMLCNLMFML